MTSHLFEIKERLDNPDPAYTYASGVEVATSARAGAFGSSSRPGGMWASTSLGDARVLLCIHCTRDDLLVLDKQGHCMRFMMSKIHEWFLHHILVDIFVNHLTAGDII